MGAVCSGGSRSEGQKSELSSRSSTLRDGNSTLRDKLAMGPKPSKRVRRQRTSSALTSGQIKQTKTRPVQHRKGQQGPSDRARRLLTVFRQAHVLLPGADDPYGPRDARRRLQSRRSRCRRTPHHFAQSARSRPRPERAAPSSWRQWLVRGTSVRPDNGSRAADRPRARIGSHSVLGPHTVILRPCARLPTRSHARRGPGPTGRDALVRAGAQLVRGARVVVVHLRCALVVI